MTAHAVEPLDFEAVPYFDDPAEVAVAQATYDYAVVYADATGEAAALGYQPEWVQALWLDLLSAKRGHGVCRYRNCLQPAVWHGGPDLEHDGGWCDRFHAAWGQSDGGA